MISVKQASYEPLEQGGKVLIPVVLVFYGLVELAEGFSVKIAEAEAKDRSNSLRVFQ